MFELDTCRYNSGFGNYTCIILQIKGVFCHNLQVHVHVHVHVYTLAGKIYSRMQ